MTMISSRDSGHGRMGTLLDLTRLQREWVEASAENLAALKQLLNTAPTGMKESVGYALLAGDLSWAESVASTVVYDWLGDKERFFCLKPQFVSALLDGLSHAYGLDRVVTPSLVTGLWEEEQINTRPDTEPDELSKSRKERLAFVSPLPPQRSGVADYAMDLLGVLVDHFAIDIVVDPGLDIPLPKGVINRLSFKEFARSEGMYRYVLYQIGNSPAHLPIMELLSTRPGVVVLHDFFLSHVLCSPEADVALGGSKLTRLYTSHGYGACVAMRQSELKESDQFVWDYPCNLRVLQQASGVIVHNDEGTLLVNRFYSRKPEVPWSMIPHLKKPLPQGKRSEARDTLGIDQKSFVVCSFGFLGKSKCSVEILNGFLESTLAREMNVQLIFVGSAGKDYRLQRAMQQSLEAARKRGDLHATTKVTGWTSSEEFQNYLLAADLAIQLRRDSRGETSGGVMSCLAGGVPLIVNCHGSMKEIPDGCALKLPDACDTDDIRLALEDAYINADIRQRFGTQGRLWLEHNNDPVRCASLYAESIRNGALIEQRRNAVLDSIVSALSQQDGGVLELESVGQDSTPWNDAIETLSLLQSQRPSNRQLMIDVSALARENLGTGVQRVVLSICKQLLLCPPQGTRVEPVVECEDGVGYQYARKWTSELLELNTDELADEKIVYSQGDIFLGLDLHHDGVCRQRPFFSFLRAQGVSVFFTIYDLLPCDLPDCFPEGTAERHHRWLEVVAQSDGAICISADVANRLEKWMESHASYREKDAFKIGWFHLGSDFIQASNQRVLRDQLSPDSPVAPVARFAQKGSAPVLLMVGTIEPRKAYLDAIEAATHLWNQGIDFMLVIVGREGWVGLRDSKRRTIPETIRRLRSHPEAGNRLLWFYDATDSVLAELYELADALVCTSLGEGFGLPLVEAAQHNLPLLVRDLPVFSEISKGEISTFPEDATRKVLAQHMQAFLSVLADEESALKARVGMQPISWHMSSRQLVLGLGLEPGTPMAKHNPVKEAEAGSSANLMISPPPGRRRFALLASGLRRTKAVLRRGRNWLKRQRYRLRPGARSHPQETIDVSKIKIQGWESGHQSLLRALARRSPT